MKTLFSKSTGGFYREDIHGALSIMVSDPVWVRPKKQIEVIPAEWYLAAEGEEILTPTLHTVPDMDAVAPQIEVRNPACQIPLDAVEITAEQHAALIEGQSSGKVISADSKGRPVIKDRPAMPLADQKDAALAAIDLHYEALYVQSVVNSAIAAEYKAAFDSATAWLLDTKQPVPERIVALAEGYGVTNAQAAQVVVQKWTEAQSVAFDRRGAARLRAKTAIRAAKDGAAVDAQVAAGRAAMESVKFAV